MRHEPIGPTDAPKGQSDPNLSRPAVGPGDEPPPPRPDRRRRPRPGGARGPGRAPAVGDTGHRPWRPAHPADHPAAMRPALATHLPGGDPWPLTSSPGRTRSGRCCPGSRPGSGSPGPMSRRRLGSPGRPSEARSKAGPNPVYLRSGGRTTSPLHSCTSGADSPAQTAGESAPSVSGWANLRFARSQATADWSIHPGCLGDRLGSVARQGGGRP